MKCSNTRNSSPSTMRTTATAAAVVSILRCTRRLVSGSREAVTSRNGTSASFGPIPISSTRNVSIAPAAVIEVCSIFQVWRRSGSGASSVGWPPLRSAPTGCSRADVDLCTVCPAQSGCRDPPPPDRPAPDPDRAPPAAEPAPPAPGTAHPSTSPDQPGQPTAGSRHATRHPARRRSHSSSGGGSIAAGCALSRRRRQGPWRAPKPRKAPLSRSGGRMAARVIPSG